ncbi:hypothetical protein SMGD1_0251 [Sulfurimonas gotlandica GD1]|uniref:Uncharacterized protein n=1 Tax=Sulfurimonas gotlandica (strain DSM 19862 / JCM 16533 / GD1) TaxID=929558 RepID=H1FTK2_SULGG|nr:hypothetical protein SMGD1_0251 [Sulfurimonas gotlandica GD1]
MTANTTRLIIELLVNNCVIVTATAANKNMITNLIINP